MLITCPHCDSRATIRTSRSVSEITREVYLQCENIECAHTWKAYLSAAVTIAPSMTPKPGVFIPLSPRSPAAQTPQDAQGCLTLDEPAHPRAMASHNTS
mgnify:CR=1 FL=1